MATYDVCETNVREVPAATGLLAPLLRVWAHVKDRVEERRIVHQLYRLDAHVLRDMGFDPHAIYAAREGVIGEWKSRKRAGLD
jgi:uncharacterized protein YjiS (DUF1127 family)